jgi:hypothetical protein
MSTNEEEYKKVVQLIAKEISPMYLAALVLGFNEMARHGKTMGDKVYFRLLREQLHDALKLCDKDDWQITFLEEQPLDPQSEALRKRPDQECK